MWTSNLKFQNCRQTAQGQYQYPAARLTSCRVYKRTSGEQTYRAGLCGDIDIDMTDMGRRYSAAHSMASQSALWASHPPLNAAGTCANGRPAPGPVI